MTYSPLLTQALVEARIDDLRRTGAASARGRGESGPDRLAEGIRRRTGWLLVGMGLRLAMPARVANRPVARGQR